MTVDYVRQQVTWWIVFLKVQCHAFRHTNDAQEQLCWNEQQRKYKYNVICIISYFPSAHPSLIQDTNIKPPPGERLERVIFLVLQFRQKFLNLRRFRSAILAQG